MEPPAPPPPVLPPVKRRLSLPLLLAGGLFGLLLVLVMVALALRPRPRSQPVEASPTPTAGPLSEPSPASPTIPVEVTRLPLTDLAGHALVVAAGSDTWLFDFTLQGPRKSPLASFAGPIADLSISPNGKLLAVVYASPGANLSAPPYPSTGLTVLDLSNATSRTEYIPLGNTPVRYPVWSADSLYLAVWNDGRSLNLFSLTDKTLRLDIAAPGDEPIGPPVFVPRRPAVSYVLGGILYESDYAGVRTPLTEGVTAVRTVPDRPQLPNPHHYSPTGSYLAFHDSLGQLVLFNRSDGSRHILAEWAKNQGIADKFSYGAPVFFDTLGRLIYYDLKQPSYQPGVDDNPLYIFDGAKKAATSFFANPKTPINLLSLIPAPAHDRLVLAQSGFRVYASDSSLQANCDYTGFTYAFYSSGGGLDYTSPAKVWSPDGKFLFSLGTNQIAQVSSCAVTAPFDSTRFDIALWIK